NGDWRALRQGQKAVVRLAGENGLRVDLQQDQFPTVIGGALNRVGHEVERLSIERATYVDNLDPGRFTGTRASREEGEGGDSKQVSESLHGSDITRWRVGRRVRS